MDHKLTCVLDTNICIDLHSAGIASVALDLPVLWLLPDLVQYELRRPSTLFTAFKRVSTRSLDGGQVGRLQELRGDKRLRRLTLADLSCLVLAHDERAVLVTNDGRLRAVALEQGVTCHGTLWILDALVSKAKISRESAAIALQSMLAAGSWLPYDECQKRIRAWCL